MKQFHLRFIDEKNFHNELDQVKAFCDKGKYNEVSFFLTWNTNYTDSVDKVVLEIKKYFPHSIYYGNECSDCISDSELYTGISILCTVLEDKSSKMEFLWINTKKEDGPKSFDDLWNICKNKSDLKAIELIPSIHDVETFNIDNTPIDIPKDILVFGGASCNTIDPTDKASIFANEFGKTLDGIVVILYSGKNLHIEARQFHGWKGVGKNMVVTQSNKREINEIDNLPAYSIYENYLNLSIGKDETSNHFKFPLLVNQNGFEYVVIPQYVLANKSMHMFLNVAKGSTVRMAYGEKQAILNTVKNNLVEMSKFEPQCIKMYNCGGRKYFWGIEDADKEVRLFKKLASTSGSFTGTEFFKIHGKIKALNATIVTASFREGEKKGENKFTLEIESDNKESLVSKLAYFVGKMTEAQETQYAHEKIKADVLNYIINFDGNPIEILKKFAERLRQLFKCDQILYRDLNEIRIIANDKSLENNWTVPSKYCLQCEHYNIEHPMYAKGFVEMQNCQKGYMGIQTYHKCPVKSALTQIVYCDGKAIGFLSLHYINNYHNFSENERKTLQGFARILSICISRYETKKENAELKLYEKIAEQKEKLEQNAELINTLISDYSSVYFIDVENNKLTPCSLNNENRPKFDLFFNENLTYENALNEFVENLVYETDKELVLKSASLKNLTNKLRNKKSITKTFRSHKNGKPYFCEIKFIKADNDNEPLTAFAIGFAEKDDEIIHHYSTYELENEYLSIFYVNLANNTYRTIRNEDKLKFTENNEYNWEKSINEIAKICEPKYQKILSSIGNINFLKKEFSSSNRREYIYKIPSTEQPWRRAIIKVVERKKNIPQAMLVSVIGIDDERSKRIDLEAKVIEQAAFLSGMSKEFYVAWLINESTKKMHTLQHFFKKSKDIALYIQTDNQPYEENALAYANVFVHPSDRKQFLKDVQFDVIKKNILKHDVHVVTFKHLNSDGGYSYHQVCFSNASEEKDSLNILIAFRNVDNIIREQIHRENQLKLKSEELDIERFRADVMLYLTDFEPKIDDFIKHFADRLLELLKADQIIYRDFDNIQIQKRKKGIDPISSDICKHCAHYDLQSEVYKNDDTELPNTKIGYNGIPINTQCPIKSIYTKVIKLNEKKHGYFAVQYIKESHKISDSERKIIEVFCQLIGIALNYIDSKKSKKLLYEKNIQEIKKSRQIVNNYINEYDTVYIVNMEKDSFEVIKSHTNNYKQFESHLKFSETIQTYIKNNVSESDQEMLLHESIYKNIKKRLEKQNSYSLEYRDRTSVKNRVVWCNLSISALSENGEILLAMRMNNDSIVKRLVDEKIHAEFTTILLVDIRNDLLTFISRSENSGFMNEFNGKYTDIIKMHERRINENYKDKWEELCNLDRITRLLTKEKRIEYVYQLVGIKNKWRRCILQVLDEENCIPTTFIMTFMTIDSKSAAEFELNEQIAKQKIMLENQQTELEKALNMAQMANRAKTTFLNNMSHDIRTPMNAIIGYTDLASTHIDNKEQVQDYLSKINQSSSHLLSLINDVLDMSRIESGNMKLNEKNENLSEIIHTMRDIVQADVQNKQLNIFIDLVDIKNEYILCDKLRLHQVLLNILSNAIKYTPPKGTISLRIIETTLNCKGYANYEFYVKDNGIGMDAEFLKTIYEPFTRVKSSTVSGIQGTGLGMSITKNIVNMMGGSISINSESNKGTEVKIIVNFKIPENLNIQSKIPELEGSKCLVFNKDSNIRHSISNMVNSLGMHTEWCSSSKEAIDKIEKNINTKNTYKVCIISCQTPTDNDIENIRCIREAIGNSAYIIIIADNDWSYIETKAQEAGVTAFLSSPLFPSDLKKVLNKCIGNNQEELNSKKALSFKNKKILLVDDNDLNREIANEILMEAGFILTNAKNGQEALDIVKNSKTNDIDVILMDVQMPIMDGCEATQKIRELGTEISKIPILAMTANAFEEDRKLVLDAGMNDHITKPIDINKLLETLAKYL